jgi:YfiH family protein
MPHLFLSQSNKQNGNLSLHLDPETKVKPRRDAFLSKHKMSSQDCVFIDTEHSDTIVHVGVSNKGQDIPSEALITNEIGVVLYLLTADCFPVTFYDPEKQIIALAHLGWKPTDKQLAAKILQELTNVYQSNPSRVQVCIGPGIHKESYTFKDPVQRNLPGWSDFLIDQPNGETQIDLMGYIQKQLLDNGVLPENIQLSQIDTATSHEYFSHYRSARTGEPEGRFATIAALV